MRPQFVSLAMLAVLASVHCATPATPVRDYSAVSRVDSGKPVAAMLTAYSTTLWANGKDWTRLRIAETDSLSREIRSASDSVRIYVAGDGRITSLDGEDLPLLADTAGQRFTPVRLEDGLATVAFGAGTTPDTVRVEARSGALFPGGHEIHTIPADVKLEIPTEDQLPVTSKAIQPMIGADISFLPQIENRAMRSAQGSGGSFEKGRRWTPCNS